MNKVFLWFGGFFLGIGVTMMVAGRESERRDRYEQSLKATNELCIAVERKAESGLMLCRDTLVTCTTNLEKAATVAQDCISTCTKKHK